MLRAFTGLLFALFSCGSFAQDDAVLIEATRFPEEVRRLPASTTVITANDFARSAARTLPELLQEQAGFTMKDLYGNNAAITSMDLRGFGVTGPQNTLILLDGRRVNDFDLSGVQWAAIPLASIERIEVLRGTGGVLYGDAASAGVVNIITRSPLRRGVRAEALGRVASYDTLEGLLYGGYGGQTLGIDASVHGYRSHGYRANNRNEQRNTTLNLRWALGEGALDLRLGTDRQDLRLPGGRLVQPSIGLDELAADRRGAQTPLDFASRDGQRAGFTLLQYFGTVEASVGLDYRDKDARSFFDQSGFPTYRADDLSLRSLTPRLRVPFETAGVKHRVTLGADWHEWEYDSRRTDRPENLAQPTNRVRVIQRTRGVYVFDSIDLAASTLATLGYRWERARYAGDDTVDPTAPACFFCAAAPSVRKTQNQRAWEIGLKQALGGGFSLFGRVNRSFRFVNAEEIYESDAFFAPQFQLLRPQHARTYEAGAEWRRGGHALRAALFRTDVADEIHLDPFTTGVGNTNLPPSRRQGLELDVGWQVLAQLRLAGGYAYTDARFLEGTLAGGPFAIGSNMNVAGRTVPLVPRHKLNLALIWDIAARTRASANLTALSKQVLDNDEPNTLAHRIPAYYVLDVKLAQTFPWGRLSAAVNNALDEKYYTYAVRSAFIADRYAAYPLPGRTLSLTAEVSLP
jgi:iron complex outermembrane recepter protein